MPSLARAINEEPQQLKPLPASEAGANAIASLLNTQALAFLMININLSLYYLS